MIHIAYSDRYVLDLPEGHKFPMIKYELIREQLLYEGTATAANFHDPGLVEEPTLLLTHTSDYWHRLKSGTLTDRELRKIGFPRSKKLVLRSRNSVQGTVSAAHHALQYGIGMNTAGGTHHAYTDRGEGFCLMNDIGVAANDLLHKKLVKQVLIVDLDVHQGNGTAQIFEGNEHVFTFSMHCNDNYPLKKEKSDLDIGLRHGTGDAMYLALLETNLDNLIEQVKPDFIFYLAGVDVLETDKLGKLSLSKQACKQRDELVLERCQRLEIPVAVSMGGGYSPRVSDIVEAHCNTFRTAFGLYE